MSVGILGKPVLYDGEPQRAIGHAGARYDSVNPDIGASDSANALLDALPSVDSAFVHLAILRA